MGLFDRLNRWWDGLPREETGMQILEDLAHNRPLSDEAEALLRPTPDTRHVPPEYRPPSVTHCPPGHFFFGGRILPLEKLRSTFLLGMSGSGKSHSLMILTRNVAESIRHRPGTRLLIVASKEDAAESLHGLGLPFTTLDITNPDSPFWDIAKDFDSPSEFRSLAEALVPADEKNPFWSQAAQAFLWGVMNSFSYRFGHDWRLSDVLIATLSPLPVLERILELCPANEYILNTTFRDAEEIGETRENIRLDLYVRLSRLFPLAAHCQKGRTPFSLRRFLSGDIPDAEKIVVLQPNLAARQATIPMVHALVVRTTDLTASLPDSTTRKIVVTLDEAQFLGKIPSISNFTAFTRSKGGALIFSSQTVDGLYKEYGQHDAESIIGNFPYLLFLRQGTPLSAKWCAGRSGSLQVWEERDQLSRGKDGFGRSTSWGWAKRERLTDSDLLYLPLASPDTGIHGYYLVPEAGELYKYVIPGSVVDSLRPKRKALPMTRRKTFMENVVSPWNVHEMKRFLADGDEFSRLFDEYFEQEFQAELFRAMREKAHEVFSRGG